MLEGGRHLSARQHRQVGIQRKFTPLDIHYLTGFTHFCDKTRKGGFKLGRKTAITKFRQKMKEMNEWLKGVRNLVKLEEWWKVLRLKAHRTLSLLQDLPPAGR